MSEKCSDVKNQANNVYTTTTGINYTINTQCGYRLPCGICRLTMQLCYKNNLLGSPIWPNYDPIVTCKNEEK